MASTTLPFVGTRRRSVFRPTVEVVCIDTGDLESAIGVASGCARTASVPCTPVVYSPIPPAPIRRGVEIRALAACDASPRKAAKFAVESCETHMVAFVSKLEGPGWLQSRRRCSGWLGPLESVPDVGWERHIFCPGLADHDDISAVVPPTVGIVVTVFNRPEVMWPCVTGVLARTAYPFTKIFIIDDGSDEYTECASIRFDSDPRVGVYRCDSNNGYLNAANHGVEIAMEAGCDYALLLNSDTRVTEGWLSAMVRCAIRTGAPLINPLCNNAALMSVPYGPGRSYLEMGDAVSLLEPKYPDATPALGHCLMISADAWREHGPFNGEVYGDGYGEECELWALLRQDGERARVADDAYVYHEGHATMGSREVEAAGLKRFYDRHGDTYRRAYIEHRQSWGLTTSDHQAIASRTRPTSLPIAFVVHSLGPWGATACILSIVERLNEFGLSASTAYIQHVENKFKHPFSPAKFSSAAAMAKWTDKMGWSRGIVVATHWQTAKYTDAIVAQNPSIHAIAFWQDREDWFLNPDGEKHVGEEDIGRYVAIEDRVVNASWVAETAGNDLGVKDFSVIPVGVDCHLFHPGRPPTDRAGNPVRVLSMWRPITPRRGHKRIELIYRRLKKKYGDRVILEVYGEPCEGSHCDVSHGWLSQRGVADLLREVDIYFEPSDFQGFGLPGLEAMASAVSLVSTDNMGIHEYGTNEENCLIGISNDDLFAVLVRLIDDDTFRHVLGDSGRLTAVLYDWSTIAARWIRYLASISSGRWDGRYDQAMAVSLERAEVVLCES